MGRALGRRVADRDDRDLLALGVDDTGLGEVGERRARLEGLVDRRLLRAPALVLLDVLLARRVGAAERVALVADDGEDLVVGEVATGERTLGGHHTERAGQVRAALAIGVAVAGDAGEVVLVGARSRRSAAGPRCAGTSTSTSPSLNWRPTPPSPVEPWQLAHVLYSSAPTPSGPVGLLGRLGHRADVHEQPDRQQAEGEHGPERDLLARLGRRDVRRIGLRRRRWRGCGRRLATDRAGRCGAAGPRPPPSWPAWRPPARPRRRRPPRSSPPPNPSAERRSRDRFSRCSGISVTRRSR